MSEADREPGRGLRADAADNERAVLDAAAVLLAHDPQAGTDEIAAAAGVSRATVYRRFPNRGQLLTALRFRAAAESRAALAAIDPTAGPAANALDRVLTALAELALRYQALFLDGLTGDHPTDEYGAIRTELTDLVARGQREGALVSEPPASWVVSVISAHLAALARASRRGLLETSDPFAGFRTTLLHGISAPPPGDWPPSHLSPTDT